MKALSSCVALRHGTFSRLVALQAAIRPGNAGKAAGLVCMAPPATCDRTAAASGRVIGPAGQSLPACWPPRRHTGSMRFGAGQGLQHRQRGPVRVRS